MLIDNDASNPRLYELSFALSAANTTKPIQSVTAAQNGGVLNVMGVSVAPTASISGISPGPAGAGVPATLTGVGLAGATSLVINGALATSLTNTGTAITFRVPAGASATGTSSVTTPNNTATSPAFTYLPAPGNALALDGVDDYVAGTAAALPQGNAARTLEAWVLTTAPNGVIFNYGTATTNQRAGLLVSNGNLYYVGENNDLRGNVALNDGHWHHVAATYDPATNTRSLYLDGALVSQDNPSTSTPHAVPDANNLRIGSTNFGEHFPGSIDEVRVWSVPRTAAQLAATRSISIAGSTTGLVAYYRLNENGGTAVADATGTAANAGTLVRSPRWTVPGAPVAYGQPVALTVTDNQGTTSTTPLVVTVIVPAGTTAVAWSGATSTDWLSCQNWSYGLVPTASVSVLPGGQPRSPSLTAAGTYSVSSLTITSGASLTSAAAAELQVNGDLLNSGTTSLSGPVTFAGAAATQALGGSSASTFGALAVRKASGTVQLGQNATVGTSLTMAGGLLDTQAYQLLVAPGATSSETDASYVLGSVAATHTLAHLLLLRHGGGHLGP